MCKFKLILISVVVTTLSFPAGCKKERREKKPTPGATSQKTAAPPAIPKLVPLWEKEMNRFVVAGASTPSRLYAITFGGTRKRMRARKQSTFEAVTGVMHWQKRRAMSTFRYGLPAGVQFALREDAVYYLSKHHNVIPLSHKGGGAGKGINARAGFLDFGTSLFIAENAPYMFDPATGDKKPFGPLTQVKKGIRPSVLRSFPARRAKSLALVRTTDGYLRALDTTSLKEVWRVHDPLDSKKYVYDLPLSGETLLVPVLYPTNEVSTRVRFPTAEGEGEVDLPGMIMRGEPPMVHGKLLSLFITQGKRSKALSTIDLEEGRLLYTMNMPTRICAGASGYVVCRKGKRVLVYSQSTGEKLIDRTMPLGVSFVAVGGEMVAFELSDRTIHVMKAATGKDVWSGKISIKNAPCHLRSLEYAVGDRVALGIRTEWETKPRLNRIYLRLFSTTLPDSFINIKLGKPAESKRYGRIDADRTVPLNLPLWASGNTIYSVVEGLYQAIDVNKGKVIKSFQIPGKKGEPISLIGRRKGTALIEYGRLLVAVSEKHRVLWRKSVKERELTDLTENQAAFRHPGGFEIVDLVTGKLAENPFKEDPGTRFIAFYKGAWLLKQGSKAISFEGGAKQPISDLPSRYFFASGRDILASTIRTPLKHKASWTAVNIGTGKPAWSHKFSSHPTDLGMAKSIAELAPRYASGEAPWWAVGTPGGFLVPGAAHRCIYLIEPAEGKVIWTRCFHRLGGAPLVLANGDVLVSAVQPWHEPGKPFKGEAPKDEGRLGLFLLKSSSHKLHFLYEHPELSSQLPLTAPDNGAPLVISLYRERKIVKKSILKAFTFGKSSAALPTPSAMK